MSNKYKILSIIFLVIALISLVAYLYIRHEEESFEEDFSSYAENSVSISRELENTTEHTITIEETSENTVTGDLDILSDEAVSENQVVENVKRYVNVISIEDGDILAYIYPNTSYNSLKKGVGHIKNTADLGAVGNCAIAGHSSTKFKCVFNALMDLRLFTEITIYDADGKKYIYYIVEKYVVSPDDTECLQDPEDGLRTLTLVTCTDAGFNRLIVVAKELDEYQLAEYKEQVNNKKIYDLIEVNDSLEVENISYLLDGVYGIPTMYYKVPVIHNADLSRTTLVWNNILLRDLYTYKEYNYTYNFNLGLGLNLVEVNIETEEEEDDIQ